MTLYVVFAAIVFIFGFVVAFGAPYLPSLRKEVRAAFTKLYPVGKSDVVVDLGSGDGQVLIEATKLGARGYGYELNPVLVFVSRLRLKKAATVQLANMWAVQLPRETTLVYFFGVSRDGNRLAAMMQREADRLSRPITVMTFGPDMKGQTPLKRLKAHALYEFIPRSTK